MSYKVIKCMKCGFIQVTAARRFKCRRCNYSGRNFIIYGEFDEDWEATDFIQRLKERLLREKSEI